MVYDIWAPAWRLPNRRSLESLSLTGLARRRKDEGEEKEKGGARRMRRSRGIPEGDDEEVEEQKNRYSRGHGRGVQPNSLIS